jgi:hypothetical protein
LNLSHNNEYFAIMGKDRIVRVYEFKSGLIYRTYDETFQVDYQRLIIKVNRNMWKYKIIQVLSMIHLDLKE